MDTEDAIAALLAFCQEHAESLPRGKTMGGTRGSFERALHVEWQSQGQPLWAWINTMDRANSIGFNFPRGKIMSYGPKPFTGYPNRVTMIRLA